MFVSHLYSTLLKFVHLHVIIASMKQTVYMKVIYFMFYWLVFNRTLSIYVVPIDRLFFQDKDNNIPVQIYLFILFLILKATHLTGTLAIKQEL